MSYRTLLFHEEAAVSVIDSDHNALRCIERQESLEILPTMNSYYLKLPLNLKIVKMWLRILLLKRGGEFFSEA